MQKPVKKPVSASNGAVKKPAKEESSSSSEEDESSEDEVSVLFDLVFIDGKLLRFNSYLYMTQLVLHTILQKPATKVAAVAKKTVPAKNGAVNSDSSDEVRIALSRFN